MRVISTLKLVCKEAEKYGRELLIGLFITGRQL
jgi:hypothetical protein